MAIVRWRPSSDLVSLRHAMDRLFEDSLVRPTQLTGIFGQEAETPIDIYQTDDNIVVKASIPGVKPEDTEITITGDTLTIKGETKSHEEAKEENYFRREMSYGSFSRSILLPNLLQTDKAEATFDNGVLTLTIPKAEETKPKQIKIKPKGTVEGEKG